LCEHHDELNHGFSGGRRRVKLLAQRDDVNVMLFEESPQVDKVLEASGNAVELEANNDVDVSCRDIAFQPL
jgi:hypothetical protein